MHAAWRRNSCFNTKITNTHADTHPHTNTHTHTQTEKDLHCLIVSKLIHKHNKTNKHARYDHIASGIAYINNKIGRATSLS